MNETLRHPITREVYDLLVRDPNYIVETETRYYVVENAMPVFLPTQDDAAEHADPADNEAVDLIPGRLRCEHTRHSPPKGRTVGNRHRYPTSELMYAFDWKVKLEKSHLSTIRNQVCGAAVNEIVRNNGPIRSGDLTNLVYAEFNEQIPKSSVSNYIRDLIEIEALVIVGGPIPEEKDHGEPGSTESPE